MEKSQRSDSNRQPLVYKTRALPLSYVGVHPWVVQAGLQLTENWADFQALGLDLCELTWQGRRVFGLGVVSGIQTGLPILQK